MRAVCYIVAQVLGGLVGVAIVKQARTHPSTMMDTFVGPEAIMRPSRVLLLGAPHHLKKSSLQKACTHLLLSKMAPLGLLV